MDKTRAIVKKLHDAAAKMLKEKLSHEEIVSELKKMGVSGDYAETVLSNALESKSGKKEFYKHLFAGIFVLAAGVAITVGSYNYAQPGGLFLVFTGLIVYGIFLITRAFVIFK